jgi:hypothetical protein
MLAAGSNVGCGGAPPPAVGPLPGERAPFQRVVTGIPVLDADGRPYEHPWLGGLNQPRPQLVDIDLDGDLDLFVQESSGRVMFFEDTGSAGRPNLVWRTDRFADLDVGEWYRFADVDGDGDPDLLAEEPFSYLRLYRNDGPVVGGPAWSFVLAADSLRDATGKAIFSDRQNIPNVADIDCDGRLDLLIGRLTGTVTRYEEVDRDARGVPVFRHVTDRFENISIVRQMGSLHGANTLALADPDDDGDLDLFWGDFFEPGLLLIENSGSCERPDFTGRPRPFPPDDPLSTSGYNAPTPGDLDADGDVDLLVGVLGGAYDPGRTTVRNLHLLVSEGSGRWTDVTGTFLRGIDAGSDSAPLLVDWDGDGDLDLLVANRIEPGETTARLRLFENTGSAAAASFRLRGVLPIEGAYQFRPALGDLDADGDLDLLLGTWNRGIWFFRNVGTRRDPVFERQTEGDVGLTRGNSSSPALGDLDGDGDLDLVAGEGSGEINVWRNEGTATAPRFVLVTDRLNGVDVGRRSAPALVDVDSDGDLDLVVGSEGNGIRLFRREGGEAVPVFVPDASLELPAPPPLSVPAAGDLDGDGALEWMSGSVSGGVELYRRLTTSVRAPS